MVALARLVAEILGLVLFYTRPVSNVLIYYIYLLFMGKTEPLPPIKNKLLLMSAKELAEKIRRKQLKSEDVVRAYIERAKEVQPYINAITGARYKEALKEAQEIDQFIESGTNSVEDIEKDTPLLGVPFSAKEALGIKGLAQTSEIVKDRNRVAEEDSDVVRLYKAAGAIPLTVTNVPELCMWWNSSNLNFGICRNPYDNHRVVGGSSGGEDALITSADAIMGIGTDIGASIRVPASFNGIYGHKPSVGVVSSKGFYPAIEDTVDHFNSTGPICRYVEDLPILMKICSGYKSKLLKLQEQVDFHHVKVYFMEGYLGKLAATSDIKKSVKKAATYFEEQYGIKPIPVKINEMKDAVYMWECKFLETNPPPFKLCMADEKGKVSVWWEFFKTIFRCNSHTIPILFYSMIDRRDKDQFYYDMLRNYNFVEQKFLDIFKEDAIFIMPTHPEPPTFYHLTILKYLNIGYTSIFNLLGFPVTNVPAGFSNGLPIGLQVVSGKLKDHLTIAAEQELDKCFGGWKGPSAIAVS